MSEKNFHLLNVSQKIFQSLFLYLVIKIFFFISVYLIKEYTNTYLKFYCYKGI